jgi:hypothetical protein
MDDLANLHLAAISGYENGADSLLVDPPSMAPSKMKRPPNAFLLYCIENRTTARGQHPDKPNVEISRILAESWKQMDEAARAPYKIRAQQQQQEFKQVFPEYKYDKAKLRRAKKASEFDTKHHIELPDIVTLVNMPIPELREWIGLLQGEFLMSCQQNLPECLQVEAENLAHEIVANFPHDEFQTGR